MSDMPSHTDHARRSANRNRAIELGQIAAGPFAASLFAGIGTRLASDLGHKTIDACTKITCLNSPADAIFRT